MKFLVDSLPYYGEECPSSNLCNSSYEECLRHWSKYRVISVFSLDNPHKCEYLKEMLSE